MKEGRTRDQKAQLVQEITEAVVRVIGSKPESVTIVIHEHPEENLARAGKLLSDKTA
jgi:4-oxalocrotonate tautomerase family enzyme